MTNKYIHNLLHKGKDSLFHSKSNPVYPASSVMKSTNKKESKNNHLDLQIHLVPYLTNPQHSYISVLFSMITMLCQK